MYLSWQAPPSSSNVVLPLPFSQPNRQIPAQHTRRPLTTASTTWSSLLLYHTLVRTHLIFTHPSLPLLLFRVCLDALREKKAFFLLSWPRNPHPVYSPVHDNQIWSDIILSVPLSEPLHNPSGLPSLVLKGPVSFSLPTCLAITTSSTKSPLHLGIVFILSVPGRPFVNLLFVFDCCHVGYSCPVSLCFFHQAFFSFASSSSRTGP